MTDRHLTESLREALLRPWWPGRMGFRVAFALAALGASLTLLAVDQATSVDANNWLIWARQASIGNAVDMTHGITVFKALPVLWAMPFARISPQAGDIAWMWLVRFGALSCEVMLFALAARRFGRGAGLIAALLPLALPTWFAYALDGDSEPIAAALLLGAATLLVRRRLVLACIALSLAILVRPEAIAPLLALLAWTVIRRGDIGSAAKGALASACVVAFGWVLFPELVGIGFGEIASGAKSVPFVANSSTGVFHLLPTSVWLLVAAGLVAVVVKRDDVLAVLSIGALAWIAEVSLSKPLGFSNGLDRYMEPAVIALLAVAAAGAAGVASALRSAMPALVVLATATALAVVLGIGSLGLDSRNVERRAKVGESSARAVAAFERAGGMDRWSGCVPFVGNGGWSLIIARRLGLPYSAFTTVKPAPALAFIPIPLPSASNGPYVTGGVKPVYVGVAKPDWAIAYFPGKDRCGR